jgi:hypothetical protein
MLVMVKRGGKWEVVEAGWVVALDKQPPKPIPERNFPWSVSDVSAGHEIVRQIKQQGGLAHVEWAIRIKGEERDESGHERTAARVAGQGGRDPDVSPDDAPGGDKSADGAVGRGLALDRSARRRTPSTCA